MIIEPTLLLDEKRCRKNIRKMVSKFSEKGVTLRPHFKTHQSIEIGTWFKELGVDKITVSSLRMAQYFADGWDDITVAFPTNILEIDRINSLAEKVTLNLLVESSETIRFLTENLNNKVGVFIKIDAGYHRTGLGPDRMQEIEEILSIADSSGKITFNGFLAHAGNTYDCTDKSDIIAIHQKVLEILIDLKNKFISNFPQCIISLGDTPSCSVAEDFEGLDEVRPGNFVFYDLTQQVIGSNTIDEIAVAMACPIVAIHRAENKIIVYGGGVHFSKDRLEDPELGTIYGRVVRHRDLSWGETIPGMYLSKLSQEHGTVHVPNSEITNYKIGDHLVILPVHSCMTSDLYRSYYNVNTGQTISRY